MTHIGLEISAQLADVVPRAEALDATLLGQLGDARVPAGLAVQPRADALAATAAGVRHRAQEAFRRVRWTSVTMGLCVLVGKREEREIL